MAVLRVVSMNMRHGTALDGAAALERQAELLGTLRRSDARNVILLQECDRWTERSGRVDQPASIAAALRLRYFFGGNLNYQGGEYGTTILTDATVDSAFHHLLPQTVTGERRHIDGTLHRPERRGLLGATLDDNLLLICIHASIWPEERRLMMEKLTEICDTHHGPLVIGGDFNTEDPAEHLLLDGLEDPFAVGAHPTFPAGSPIARIDRILTRGVEVRTTATVVTDLSDHYPVWVDLETL